MKTLKAMVIKTVLFSLFFILISYNGSAQLYVSLDSCRKLALENNSQINIAALRFQKMKYEVNAYRTNFFPRIYGQGMYLFSTGKFNYNNRFDLYDTSIPDAINGMEIPDFIMDYLNPYLDELYRQLYIDIDITLKLNNIFTAGVMLEQPLFMGGKVTAAYKMSKIGRDIASLNVQRSEAEVIQKCDQAYWKYVEVIEIQKTAKKYQEVVASICNDAKNGMETGMVSLNEVMKAQVKLGEANLMIRQAENGMRLARMNLCMVIGLSLFSEIFPMDTLSDELPTALLENIPDVTTRTEYALLNKQLDLKRQQVNLTRSDFLPQLTLIGGYNYTNGLMLNDTKLLDNGSFSGIVSLKVPITHWWEGASRIRSAKADLHIAEYQMRETVDLLQLEIMQAYNTLDEAILKAEVARDELDQTQENLRMMTDRHELGLETISTLLEAQALWQQASTKYSEAKANLRVAETNYLKVAEKLR